MNAPIIPSGALTAIITPFSVSGDVDWDGFQRLVEFQVVQGVSGIVPAGTTGESATLSEKEHNEVIYQSLLNRHQFFILAGCGSNSTKEAMSYVRNAQIHGGRAALLVDPYYNGPSSLEIRSEYYAPIAKAFPDMAIVPYIIPGRTGCRLLAEDLAALHAEYPNVCAVKEATGEQKNSVNIRELIPGKFKIFSGDDDKTYGMMMSPHVEACGVISVVSNIAPAAVQKMCLAINRQDITTAIKLRNQLQPLFDMVTVSALRSVNKKEITDKFRNPLPIKTAMNALGMPSGPCRQPLGKMSASGIEKVRTALCDVNEKSPEIFAPIEDFFNVNIKVRLASASSWLGSMY